MRTWPLCLLCAAFLSACTVTSSAPVVIKTCDAIDENSEHPLGRSRVHLVLENMSDQTAKDASVFVTYGGSSYGFAIYTNKNLRPHQSLELVHPLSFDENLALVSAKWEYHCFLESAAFADGSRWSGVVR